MLERAEQLARLTEEPGRITRRLATPAWHAAGEEVLGWMEAAGMRVRRDPVGNVVGRYEAERDGAPALLLGSHLDTVPDGGRYDGALGVLVGLAVVESLRAEGQRLPRAVELYGFADEEGSRFGTTLLGSRALTGTLDATELDGTDAEGVTIAEALSGCGGAPDQVAAARIDPGAAVGYLEVHIEQGPVLEQMDRPLGVVSAITGQTRLRLAFEGSSGHAGTVPMGSRRDALCAAAELTVAIEAFAAERPGLVATVGELTPEPGVANVIPGRASLTVDVRDESDRARRSAVDWVGHRAREIALARDVELRGPKTFVDSDSVRCAPDAIEALRRAAAEAGLEAPPLVSGAGHDAVALAEAMPVGMLLVRCGGGVSHSPEESVREDDVALAVEVASRATRALAGGGR